MEAKLSPDIVRGRVQTLYNDISHEVYEDVTELAMPVYFSVSKRLHKTTNDIIFNVVSGITNGVWREYDG